MKLNFAAALSSLVLLGSPVSAFPFRSATSNRLRSHLFSSTTTSDGDPGLFPLANRDVLDEEQFDLVLVGSGNGACGFLAHYLEHLDSRRAKRENVRILVLERGKNFFFTGDITHQDSWTKSYSQGNIFKLHDTHDMKGRPILSGGACTMGGGGSINYTMIHESSEWLRKQLGFDLKYWDDLKMRLNKKFDRDDPIKQITPITSHILKVCEARGFSPPVSCSRIANIPNQNDRVERQLYQFPTQFNEYGQRTNSGVSIVNWTDARIRLETNAQVEHLGFEKGDSGQRKRCTSVKVRFLDTNEVMDVSLVPEGGKVIVCAGAATPRLLMKHRDELSDGREENDSEIGLHVSDHFAMPLGIYVKPKDIALSPKDIYGPVFATTQFAVEGAVDPVIVSLDFFTGKLQKLLFLTSHLFLAFLLPTCVKNIVWTTPWLFSLVSNAVRIIVSILNFFITLIAGDDLEYITAIIKYNPKHEGKYEERGNRITLGWFHEDAQDTVNQDKEVAIKVLGETVLPLLDELGEQPNFIIRCLYRLFTKVPYSANQIKRYIRHYSRTSMLSEQHLAGGCLIGFAAESTGPETGLIKGSSNVHVADLSAVPLPRVSPQMTAYLVGYHVSNQLYPTQ